ncbi:MAG: hypothetical protein LBJ57_05745 [Prevotellaceae bacterium]|jgi:hypothetical protein|nr:hypothetical protein [Prevotellaceae bacterium]
MQVKGYSSIAPFVPQNMLARVKQAAIKKSPHLRYASDSIFFTQNLDSHRYIAFELAYLLFFFLFFFSFLFEGEIIKALIAVVNSAKSEAVFRYRLETLPKISSKLNSMLNSMLGKICVAMA